MPLPKHLPQRGASGVVGAKRGSQQQQQLVARRYRMGERLGSGAFGCAYLVTDTKENEARWAWLCACSVSPCKCMGRGTDAGRGRAGAGGRMPGG